MLRLEELLFLSAPEIAVVSVEEHDEAIRIGIRCRAAGARGHCSDVGVDGVVSADGQAPVPIPAGWAFGADPTRL